MISVNSTWQTRDLFPNACSGADTAPLFPCAIRFLFIQTSTCLRPPATDMTDRYHARMLHVCDLALNGAVGGRRLCRHFEQVVKQHYWSLCVNQVTVKQKKNPRPESKPRRKPRPNQRLNPEQSHSKWKRNQLRFKVVHVDPAVPVLTLCLLPISHYSALLRFRKRLPRKTQLSKAQPRKILYKPMASMQNRSSLLRCTHTKHKLKMTENSELCFWVIIHEHPTKSPGGLHNICSTRNSPNCFWA